MARPASVDAPAKGNVSLGSRARQDADLDDALLHELELTLEDGRSPLVRRSGARSHAPRAPISTTRWIASSANCRAIVARTGSGRGR